MSSVGHICSKIKHISNEYIFGSYVLFTISIYFMSTKCHRNYFYLFVLIPFILIIKTNDVKNLFRSKLLAASSIFCLYMAVSNSWASDYDPSHLSLLVKKAFLVVMFLIITAHLFKGNPGRFHTLFRYVCWTAGVMAVASAVWFGLFRYETLGELTYRFISIGTLDFPLTAAYSYGVAAIVAFSYFIMKESDNSADLRNYLLLFAVIISFILLTRSRGPLGSIVVIMLMSTLMLHPKRMVWVFGSLLLSFAAAILGGVYKLSYVTERGLSYRPTIWRQSFEMIADRPWFGYGMAGERPAILWDFGTLAHSHNLFLSSMVDGGIVALVLLLMVLSLAVHWAVNYFKEYRDVTLLALIIFSVLANLTDGKTLVTSPNYQWLYTWLPIGLLAAYEVMSADREQTAVL